VYLSDAECRRGGDNQRMFDQAGRMMFLGFDTGENKLS
jgi:hypothetical protein